VTKAKQAKRLKRFKRLKKKRNMERKHIRYKNSEKRGVENG